LERAAWLEARVVAFAPAILGAAGSAAPPVRYEDAGARMLEAMLELRFDAERRGLRLAIRSCRNQFLLSPMETRDLIDQINSPGVGVALDLSDVLRFGSPEDWILTLGHRLAHVTVSAGANLESAWPGIVSALKRARYEGAVTIQAHDLPAALQLAAALRLSEESKGL
jgi:sugar phosphate isomerase/epimerase